MSGITDTVSLIADPADAFGARGAKKATEGQLQASRESIAEQQRQFDIQQENLKPFREQTIPALSKVAALSGAQGAEAQQAEIDQFVKSPGQQFLQDRAQKNLLRNASAIGGLGS